MIFTAERRQIPSKFLASSGGNVTIDTKKDMNFTERVLRLEENIRKNNIESIPFKDLDFFLEIEKNQPQ